MKCNLFCENGRVLTTVSMIRTWKVPLSMIGHWKFMEHTCNGQPRHVIMNLCLSDNSVSRKVFQTWKHSISQVLQSCRVTRCLVTSWLGIEEVIWLLAMQTEGNRFSRSVCGHIAWRLSSFSNWEIDELNLTSNGIWMEGSHPTWGQRKTLDYLKTNGRHEK